MSRLAPGMLVALLVLSACGTPPALRMGPDGNPLPQVYKLGRADAATVQYRMLDAVNALREARGVAPLELDARLNAAAATHSRDMAVQGRPWNFGSDGSSTLDRVARAGYEGRVGAELISESYETELETLAGWLEDPVKREALLQRDITDMGFAFYQEESGKIWWTLVTGRTAPMVAGL